MSSSVDPVTDADGHLLDWQQWSPEFAQRIAQQLRLDLGPAHWELIELLRDHYTQFRAAPPMRLLTRLVATRLGPEKGNSRYLYQLFPDGPGKQGSLLAGLPKPVSCI